MNISKKNRANMLQWEIWKGAGAVLDGLPFETLEACDTVEGISARIRSLNGLHALLEARRKAWHKHGEKLREWAIFGTHLLDANGDVDALIDPPALDDAAEPIPTVIEREGFLSLLKAHDRGWDGELRVEHLGLVGSAIAKPWTLCTFCGQPWTMGTFTDCDQASSETLVSGAPFIGRTLNQVRKAYRRLRDPRYARQVVCGIRNDDLINLRPMPDSPERARNERGWAPEHLPSTYVIRPGDELQVRLFDQAHLACRKAHVAQAMEDAFREAFIRAGFDATSLGFTRVPNPYSPGKERWRGPGFVVETRGGKILVSWRANVIEINWKAARLDASLLFADVATLSKGPHYIHAYGYGEATDFLSRIRAALLLPPALRRAG